MAEVSAASFKGKVKPDWCRGCGDYGVLSGLQRALAAAGVEPEDVLVVSGIGCSSNLPGFIHAYGFHGLHGRALPIATGAKLANPALTVVVTGGDGDGLGIGVGHFVHSCRRNIDLTYLVMDNQTYGLTTGQASPTTEKGIRTKATPEGTIEPPVNPIALALTSGATYVARGFSAEPAHLAELIENGIGHKGFAFIDVLSPCVTYNKHNTYSWFKERLYRLEDDGHDPSDFPTAMRRALEWGERIPFGLFFQAERATHEEEEPVLRVASPTGQRVQRDYLASLMLEFT